MALNIVEVKIVLVSAILPAYLDGYEDCIGYQFYVKRNWRTGKILGAFARYSSFPQEMELTQDVLGMLIHTIEQSRVDYVSVTSGHDVCAESLLKTYKCSLKQYSKYLTNAS